MFFFVFKFSKPCHGIMHRFEAVSRGPWKLIELNDYKLEYFLPKNYGKLTTRKFSVNCLPLTRHPSDRWTLLWADKDFPSTNEDSEVTGSLFAPLWEQEGMLVDLGNAWIRELHTKLTRYRPLDKSQSVNWIGDWNLVQCITDPLMLASKQSGFLHTDPSKHAAVYNCLTFAHSSTLVLITSCILGTWPRFSVPMCPTWHSLQWNVTVYDHV